jgi:pimeloyl-ACP methyl ester carboxylesterase
VKERRQTDNAKRLGKRDRTLVDRSMTMRHANVNGINIAYRVQGEGPPLVLVMGYRLNSTAWPEDFIEALARQFTIITLDNRGTGLSDKPVEGYAIANMARDICGLLDQLDITRVHLLGYSMGGAIAQEFVRQFPERVSSLILCATMCGGPRAIYAKSSLVRVMRDLDGLSPEQAARRIWKVTYSRGYLERHPEIAEAQMRREIALPTPLHAADLQFQAFAEFDGSKALSDVRCPALVLTGDLDELISPQNSRMMAKLIPGAKLMIIPGCGHRVMWEASDECASSISEFIAAVDDERFIAPYRGDRESQKPDLLDVFSSSLELFARWPLALLGVGFDTLNFARQAMVAGSVSRFGDGKPIILVPQYLGSDLALLPLTIWLKALGYRPTTAGLLLNLQDSVIERTLSQVIADITDRVGRKAVLITHSTGMPLVLRVASAHKERVSDIVILEAPHRPTTDDVRLHFISTGWSVLHTMVDLLRLLGNIGIELIEDSKLSGPNILPQVDAPARRRGANFEDSPAGKDERP